jgi:hypothetical protein
MKKNYFDYFADAVLPSEQLFDSCLYNTIYDNEGYEVLIPSNTDHRFSQIINTDFSDIVNKICRKVQLSSNPENAKELIRTNTRKLEKVREWKSLLFERIDEMETILFFYPVPSYNDIWAHQHYTNFEANLSRCKEGFARLVNAYGLSIAVRSALGLDRPASAVEAVSGHFTVNNYYNHIETNNDFSSFVATQLSPVEPAVATSAVEAVEAKDQGIKKHGKTIKKEQDYCHYTDFYIKLRKSVSPVYNREAAIIKTLKDMDISEDTLGRALNANDEILIKFGQIKGNHKKYPRIKY